MKRGALTLILSGILFVQSGAQPIFDPSRDAGEAIRASLESARLANKRVLLEFGADWCPDCRNLAELSESETLKAFLEERYITLRIDVGRKDRNIGLAESFGVPLSKGIPSLAILDADGTVVYASRKGEWANARRMTAEQMKSLLEEAADGNE